METSSLSYFLTFSLSYIHTSLQVAVGPATHVSHLRRVMLKVGGSFMAGLARHASAEPHTLVVRCEIEDRRWLLEDAPETYYLTDYYQPYPIVLVRLSSLTRDALRDLLTVSRRLTLAKAGTPRSTRNSRPAPGID